jgi:G3E family GTPase
MTDAEVREAERCPHLPSRIPATIVTGFLGAGKTTLVNWLLKGTHGLRFCVLQNEFGDVPVDDALIVRSERFADVAVVTLPTGCICCKVRGDLVEGLKALAQGVLSEGDHFDAVVIETSGLSEVAPVAQTFFADRFVQQNFRLDAVLAVADAERAPAALRLAQSGGVPEADIDGTDVGDSDTCSDNGSDSSLDDGECGDADSAGGGSGDDDQVSNAMFIGQAARLQSEQLCLADVVLLNKLDRVSAVEADEAEQLIGTINPTARLLRCSHAQVDLSSILHINAFSLERAMEIDLSFLASPNPPSLPPRAGSAAFAFASPPAPSPSIKGHAHAAFGSVGLEASVDLDELAFNDWLEGIFAAHSARLFRAKGVVFFRGVPEPNAVQCVGSHIEIIRMDDGFDATAAAVGRRSRLVFIGRTEGLAPLLTSSFEAIAATHVVK